MSNENEKKDDKAIIPAKQPLPAVQEVEETDLDEVSGGCLISCIEISGCGVTCAGVSKART